jgi:amidophosphoribosyltransferase
LGVAIKYNPLPDLKGKRVVLVDDSIVRGTTSGPIVALLRQAGAREVHMRVASPPIATRALWAWIWRGRSSLSLQI